MSTSNATSPKRIPFFKAGDLTSSDGRAVSFSVADLHAIAKNYEPSRSKAPLVVGHPKLDDPAFGWATSLSVEGDTLMAEVDQVEAQFAQMVNDGRFPNRSASIYLPTTPGNPKPGELYLKHIGFLGAAPPAIAGLPAYTFAADDQALCFSFDDTDFSSPTMEPSTMPEKNTSNTPDPSVEFAQRSSALDQRERQLKEREDQIIADQKASERAAAVSFAQALVQNGKLLPAEADAIVELITVLPGNDAPVSFAQAGATVTKPAREMFREFLGALPERVKYSEKSKGKVAQGAVSFAAPQGTQVDTDRTDMYAAAKEIQLKNPGMSFVDAARLAGA